MSTQPTVCLIRVADPDRTIQATHGTLVLDALRQAGIDISAACGGNGHCGRCRIIIHSGAVTAPTEEERLILSPEELTDGVRLACRTATLGNLQIDLHWSSRVREILLQMDSNSASVDLDPTVRAFPITTEPPSLGHPDADFNRVCKALADVMTSHHQAAQGGITAGTAVIAQIPPLLRQHEGQAIVFMRGNEIVGMAPPGVRPLGLAVDLGTTKIAAWLVDLENGRELAAAGRLNPQSVYGDDIMSRLHYATRHTKDRILTVLVRKAIRELLKDLTKCTGTLPMAVVDAAIVGNTAMIHLLLDLPVKQLATSPFVAAANGPFDAKAGDLDLPIAPGAYVHILPCIGGFVGGDLVAMLLSSGIAQLSHTAIGLDIGTNTEIVLHRPDLPHLHVVSCASGPAFEGAQVSNGMQATAGAIETVRFFCGSISVETIDDAPAIGLCGSGIIDALAEMHRWGIIDIRGRLQKTKQRVRSGPHGLEFLLVPSDKSGSGKDIVLTQQDIDQVQLAKGAIRAGIEVLLAETGTAPDSVSEIYLAGAFGTQLNTGNAVQIGLLPFWPNCTIRQVGNAAAAGARQALLSQEVRRRAKSLSETALHLDLALNPGFNRQFAKAMMFDTHDLTFFHSGESM